MSSISVLCKDGDKVIVEWDEHDEEQHEAARKRFKQLKEKGHIIYEVSEVGHHTTVDGVHAGTVVHHKKGEVVDDLSKDGFSHRLIARPAFAGG